MCLVAGAMQVVAYIGCQKVKKVIMTGIAHSMILMDGMANFTRAATLNNGLKSSGILKAVVKCKFH